MLLRSLLLLATKSPALNQAIQSVTAGVLGLTMLVSIVERSGGTYGEVVVHVAVTDVEVTVGDCSYRVDGRRYAPIVCDLPPGRHRLVVERDGRVLQDDPFTVERGGCLVLTAWDPDGLLDEAGSESEADSGREPGTGSGSTD